jgi:hypothetical protein
MDNGAPMAALMAAVPERGVCTVKAIATPTPSSPRRRTEADVTDCTETADAVVLSTLAIAATNCVC